MSQSTHQSTDHKRQSQDKNQTHAYAKVWLYFMYYWMIFWDWLLFWTISSYVMEKTIVSRIVNSDISNVVY